MATISTSCASPTGPAGTPASTAQSDVPADPEALRATVRTRYGAAADRVTQGSTRDGSGCCGPESAHDTGALVKALEAVDPITAELYSDEEVQTLPVDAVRASLGCGHPTALAELRPGETVLDLGSGGGIDVLLSAQRVGPTGFAYGLDMTDEMLALAESNRQQAGAANVTFLKGTIEQVPLPDSSVDVIISNCVINLSADKDAVLREAYRVLRPGGRFAVSDIVVRRDLPEAIQKSMGAWTGCIAGALHERDYVIKLTAAGFEAPEVQITRTFNLADLDSSGGAGAAASCCGAPEGATGEALGGADGALASAFIHAVKARG